MDFKNSFVAEWYDRTDFFDAKFFLLGSFFAHFFQKWWIKKWPQQKKLVKWKISFFMPINHVQEFMISVHSRIVICPFCIGGSIHLQSPCIYDLNTKVYIDICNFSFIWMTTRIEVLHGHFMNKPKSSITKTHLETLMPWDQNCNSENFKVV